MKPAFYESLDKIPETDRSDYKLVTEAGSPNFNKYVLDLDPQHPVALKNSELLGEKATRETAQATAVQAAVAPLQTEVTRLTNDLSVARTQNGLPAGQIAVPADTLTQLNNYKTLGEFDALKTKVEEHGTLKQQTETQTRKDRYSEIALANGMDEKAFVKLAEPVKLHERIETREIDDGKGNSVKHYFVKGKNEKNEDTSTAVADFVKKDGDFSPFLSSLMLSDADRKKVAIPKQGHGDAAKTKSGGSTYLEKNYKRPDAKAAE